MLHFGGDFSQLLLAVLAVVVALSRGCHISDLYADFTTDGLLGLEARIFPAAEPIFGEAQVHLLCGDLQKVKQF